MAYCRFSPRSDVYVYHNVHGYIECCGCRLTRQTGAWSQCFPTREGIIKHLIQHKEACHQVPPKVFLELRKELELHGNTVEKLPMEEADERTGT